MTLEITFKQGRWLVNEKRLEDLNLDERNSLDDFFREMKATFEAYNPDPNPYCRVRPSNLHHSQTEATNQ